MDRKPRLWARFGSKEYRDAFAEAYVDDRIAAQIYFLRKHRGWTQIELARRAGKRQPTISRLEMSCEGATLSTLKKIASAFDVALEVRFVPFSYLADSENRNPLDEDVRSYPQDHAGIGPVDIDRICRAMIAAAEDS